MEKRIGSKKGQTLGLDVLGWALLGGTAALVAIIIYLTITGKINWLLSIF